MAWVYGVWYKDSQWVINKNKTTSYYFELDKLRKPLFEKAGFMAEILQSDAYYAQKKQLLIS
jgi:aminopeptidase N